MYLRDQAAGCATEADAQRGLVPDVTIISSLLATCKTLARCSDESGIERGMLLGQLRVVEAGQPESCRARRAAAHLGPGSRPWYRALVEAQEGEAGVAALWTAGSVSVCA